MILDFGGVESIANLSSGKIGSDEFGRFWAHSRAADQLYRGQITPDVFAVAAVEELSLDVQPSKFLADFKAWLRGPYPGAFALLRDLRSQATLACLSNTNQLDVERFRQEFALHDRFDKCFFSNEIGLRKPEPAAYRHVLADLELPAERVAFFDDNPECVVGAQKAGMRAFHCVGVAPLIASLQGLGFAL